jgi:hypothetical protein
MSYSWTQYEIWTLYLGAATGGTFTMGDGTTNTAALAYNITAANLQTALEAIFGAGEVTVEDDTDFTITFSLDAGDTGLEANFASLTGATSPALTETQAYETQALNILLGTYRPPQADTILSEINVIPSVTISNPVVILQQGGRYRKTASMDCYVATLTEYNGLMDDHHDAANKTFIGPDSLEFESIISDLAPAEYVQPGFIRFNITFMEQDIS